MPGCLFGNLALEVSTRDEVIRARLNAVFGKASVRFRETLELGLKLLADDLAGLKGDTVPGETVFKLYDTFGFPVDLTADVAREQGLHLDMAGFEKAIACDRQKSEMQATKAARLIFSSSRQLIGSKKISGPCSVKL